MALLRYFTEFTYNVVLKQYLLGLHPFQNLLLIVYDHINYDLRDYSASRPIWAKQQEVTASSAECSCLSGVASIRGALCESSCVNPAGRARSGQVRLFSRLFP